MGIISTKVAAGVLAVTMGAGVAGVYFTGGETVDQVKDQLLDLRDKVGQYEISENALFEKIGLIKADATNKLTDANGKIISAKEEINNLKASKSFLETQVKNLNDEISVLEADKEKLTTDLAAANAMIEEKKAEIDQLNGELKSVQDQLETLQATYDQLLIDYNALVAENERNKEEAERANAEVQAANEKVAELGEVSEQVATDTADKEPMSQEELDAIVTENEPDVYDAELVVKNLNLTYIQDGQSPDFKAAHPDLDIQEGDRVWRVTNSNNFAVYVEYVKGSESGELVANPSQTFYMTESGGTMIIKWQDENGVWKQTVKAGA